MLQTSGVSRWQSERSGSSMDDMTFLSTMLGSSFSKGQTAQNPRSYAQTINTNITGVALMMATFLHLRRKLLDALAINISSARASLHLSSTGNLPLSKVISYSVSNMALNALTIVYAKAEPTGLFMPQYPVIARLHSTVLRARSICWTG